MLHFLLTFLAGSLLTLLTLLLLTYNGYGFTWLFLTFGSNEKSKLALESLSLARFNFLLMPLFGLCYLTIAGSALLIFVAPMQVSAWVLLIGATLLNGSFAEAWHFIPAIREWLGANRPTILEQRWWDRAQLLALPGAICLAILVGLGIWSLLRVGSRRYLLALMLPVLLYSLWMRYGLAYTYGFFAASCYTTFLVVGLVVEGLAFQPGFKLFSGFPKLVTGYYRQSCYSLLAIVMLGSTGISLAQNVSDTKRYGYTSDLKNFADFASRIPPGSSVAFFQDYFTQYQALYSWEQYKLEKPDNQRNGFDVFTYYIESQANPPLVPTHERFSFAADYLVYRVQIGEKEPVTDEHNFYRFFYRWTDTNWNYDILVYQRQSGLIARRLLYQASQTAKLKTGEFLTISADKTGIYLNENSDNFAANSSESDAGSLSLLLYAESNNNLELNVISADGQVRESFKQKLQVGPNFVVSPILSGKEKLRIQLSGQGEAELREIGFWEKLAKFNLPAFQSLTQ